MRLHRIVGAVSITALLAVAGCASSSPSTAPSAGTESSRPASSGSEDSAPNASWPDPEPALEPSASSDPTLTEAEADEEPPAPPAFGDSLAILNDSRRRGSLSSSRIEAGISRGEPAVGACVLAAARMGAVDGRVVVSFVIEPDGRVANAAFLVSTLTDDELARCVLEAVRGFEFPRPSGGIVLVSYPFQFRVTG